MGAGIQLHDLPGGDIGRIRSGFVHHRIGQKAYRTCQDVKHLAEGQIGQANKACQEMDVPEQGREVGPVQPQRNGFNGYVVANTILEDLGIDKQWSDPGVLTKARENGFL